MPHIAGKPRFDIMARKWYALAQRRLLYYGELYRSGRWTHYFASREAFAERMLDAIRAAKAWARLAGERPATRAADWDDLRPAA